METAVLFFAFIFGLVIGSFLNVVILRAFSGESIVLPPSKCPECKEKLKPHDNIPVLSYLILRGKCRYCGKKINIQYPLVELFTGIIFVLLVYSFGLTINTVFLLTAASLCIVMAVTDIKEKVIFPVHAYLLGFLGLVYNIFNFAGVNKEKIIFYFSGFSLTLQQTFIYAILGLIAGVLMMELMARIPQIFIKRRAFGEGDTYILGALGAFFGIVNVVVILILGIVIQTLAFFPVYIVKLFKTKQFRLLTSLILFIVMVILMRLGTAYNMFRSEVFYWFSFALLVCIGFYCCKKIFESMKEGKSLTYLPFGPALILGAFIIMFF